MCVQLLSVDWLQVFCHGSEIATHDEKQEVRQYLGQLHTYTAHLSELKSRLWDRIYYLCIGNERVAVVNQCPRSPLIHERATLVKIENSLLYTSNYVAILYDIISAFALVYKGVTRLDLCCDCDTLTRGRSVEHLLERVALSGKGSANDVYCCHRSVGNIYFSKRAHSDFHIKGLRLGSKMSDIGAYVYDKTLELIEVKDKPYIREYWEKNGLIYAYDMEDFNSLPPERQAKIIESHGLSELVKKRVWRFEISIKAQGCDILDMAQGELFKLSPKWCEHYDSLRNLFMAYARRVFDFRERKTAISKRNYVPMEIFNLPTDVPLRPYSTNRYLCTGRFERAVANKIRKVKQDFADLSPAQYKSMDEVISLFDVIAGCYSKIRKYKKDVMQLDGFLHKRYLNVLKSQSWNAVTSFYAERAHIHEVEGCLRTESWKSLSMQDVVHGVSEWSESELQEAICMN